MGAKSTVLNYIKQLIKLKQRLSQINQPTTVKTLFNLFDVFYVCFDEPNRKENWEQIKSIVPKAKKVEGVVGFDRALKTCAGLSRTDHFFLIDGDNQLLSDRLNNSFSVPDITDHWVLSWSSLNPINGLTYGNGGLKLWPKAVAIKINSHENARPGEDQTDYCFIADYYMINDFMTQTLVNTTPQQAFRAGVREGVKMSLHRGKQVPLDHTNFLKKVGPQNKRRLQSWCEVGADVPNGYWAILGARLGLKMNVVDQFDYQQINSYEWIDEVLKEIVDKAKGTHGLGVEKILRDRIETLGEEIEQKIPLSLSLLSSKESKDFKETFQNPSRQGLLKH